MRKVRFDFNRPAPHENPHLHLEHLVDGEWQEISRVYPIDVPHKLGGSSVRILDDESDKKLDNVSIFLTKEEAVQLRGYLNQLLDNPKLQHSHLSSSDYQKEITICLYDEKNLENFNQRSIKLIREDK